MDETRFPQLTSADALFQADSYHSGQDYLVVNAERCKLYSLQYWRCYQRQQQSICRATGAITVGTNSSISSSMLPMAVLLAGTML